MNRGKLLISLVVAAVLTIGVGSSVLPSGAATDSVTVKIAATGQTITVPGCLPVGANVAGGVVVVPCEAAPVAPVQVTPPTAPTQSTPTDTTPATTTDTTPADDTPDDEPSADTPDKQQTTGGKKGDRDKAGDDATTKDDGQDEGSSKDSDSTKGDKGKTNDDTSDTTNADGSPSLSNPTVTLADPGPAAIGVPNFVIDKFKIPPFLLPIYKAAEAQYNIPWQILAAVNEIETDYGRNLNVSTAGAVGWMQFMPATWKSYGTDANGDSRRDPYNPVDAIFSAARYLKAAGFEQDSRKGLFAYNNADWYVDSVLLRAKVIGGLPADLVSSLTQITEGRFPVAERSRYADQLDTRTVNRRVAPNTNASIPVGSDAGRQSIDIFSKANAPVIAVNDGEIAEIGETDKLGRYVILKDYAGNRYTYSQLGSVVPSYPAPKEQNVSQQQVRDELNLPKDPKPKLPASAGTQQPTGTSDEPAATTSGKTKGKGKGGKKTTKPAATPAPAPTQTAQPSVSVSKERLYGNPTRPSSYKNGGRDQLAATSGAQDFETYGAYFAKVFGLNKEDVQFKALRKGSRVVAGTILGRMGTPEKGKAPYMTFALRPAGRGAPTIDPKPILDGWKLLESTAIYRAAGKNPFLDQKSVSVGQMLLMTKEQLGRSVLTDPRIDIYDCGRTDIQGGLIDKRVLIAMKYLAGSGLRPTISALKCGHSKYVAGGGRISDHWYGRAVDVAAVNGIPILGNQQDGGITDITIRRLLQLNGSMKPSQIISLRTYQGADNTLAMSDHDDHIHIGFGATPGSGNPADDAVLKPRQWLKLIGRLGEIDNPTVPIKPSKYALPGSGDDPSGRGGD
jgi:hypothetical protein